MVFPNMKTCEHCHQEKPDAQPWYAGKDPSTVDNPLIICNDCLDKVYPEFKNDDKD